MLIETGCRLHFGLIDLNGEIGRVDGGIGLSLKNPGMEIEGEKSRTLDVTGPMSQRVYNAAKAVVDSIDGDPVKLHVKEHVPQHIGLGSGTQAAIAGGELTARLNGSDISIRKIAEITGRGGTSGIGTGAFDAGGFIVDGGHDFVEKGQFQPSSVSSVGPPPIITRIDFPDWVVTVFVPEGKGAHGSRETKIFSECCPINSEETNMLSRVILMKLLPAVKKGDFIDFRYSINRIQQIGFKKEEVKRQPKSAELIESLFDQGYAAGLSSLGPAVFAIHPRSMDKPNLSCESINVGIDNEGATIRY